MKTTVLLLSIFAAGLTPAFAQTVTLADWTFETSVPASAGPFAPEIGAGAASGSHASGATVYSSPAGNGSPHSFSSNTWAPGDYYQFQVSSASVSGIKLSWDQTSSNTGPRDFELMFSTTGTTFTNVSNYSVLANAAPNPPWNSTTPSSLYNFSFDLSSIAALNNQAAIYFRLQDLDTISANSGAVGTAGTDRVDNFIVTATAIPEPSTYALIAGFGCLAAAFWRRRVSVGEGRA